MKASWRLVGDNIRATHTAIHYGYESKPGVFNLETTPLEAGYPSLTSEFSSGDCPLSQEFTLTILPPKAGPLYFRAHAIIDGRKYWTDENVVAIEAPNYSNGY